jgi:putative flippase GtrA
MPQRPSFIRFVLIGGINTALGYGVYALFNYALMNRVPYSYAVALILSNITTISMNYINYKLFVFRTRGNYLLEYLRFFSVYGFSIGMNLVLLPILVEYFSINSYLAGLLLIPVTVVFSFLGHTNFSFRPGQKVEMSR